MPTTPESAARRGVTRVLDRIALALLSVSVVVSLALIGPVVRPAEVAPLLILAAGAAAYRLWLARHAGTPAEVRVRARGFWPNLAGTLALVVLSPAFGLYAFLGYVEAPSTVGGRLRQVAMLATAAVVALAQLGGPRSGIASWWLYGLFFAVNAAIAFLIGLIERQRDRNVADLERTLTELREARDANATLQTQLISQAREAGMQDERARLSREIHDTVAQGLVGIIAQLQAVAAEPEGPRREQRLASAQEAARDALGEARRAVAALASPRLDDATLPAALERLTADVARGTGIETQFTVDGQPEPWRGEAELLRVAQEALANVAQHARAHRARVTLTYLDDELRLDVRDDGIGFDPGDVRGGFGLAGLRERVAALGGTAEIESREGEGCAVGVAVPR